MIRNKAIVNEENSDAEYWRKKYLALLNGNQNNCSSTLNKKSHKETSLMEVDEGNHSQSKNQTSEVLS